MLLLLPLMGYRNITVLKWEGTYIVLKGRKMMLYIRSTVRLRDDCQGKEQHIHEPCCHPRLTHCDVALEG